MSAKSTAAEAASTTEGTVSTVATAATATEALPNFEAEFLAVFKRQLHPSPTNPRKEFPEPTIEEMKESIEEHGVIQPLIVRRWPEKDRAGEEAYEIVCGERRFRGASRVDKLERLPVIVRVLTDTQVCEIQIIENLQREDVSPYDEAVGYAALLALKAADGSALYTAERIAERIGKKPSYVYNRLKMQNTPKVLLEALRAGTVGTRVCELVGRIPHAEDRERCAAEVLEPPYHDRPMTGEEVEEHIRENYMIRLAGAVFDLKAEDLLPKAGSCEACSFRTGNDPELASEVSTGQAKAKAGRTAGIDPRVCQNPKCYRDKCEAHLNLVKKSAPERVLSEADAKSVFDDWGHVRYQTKMKPVERKPEYNDVGHWDTGKLKTWGDYAKRLEVPVMLAKNPKTGEVVQLVDTSAVKAAERAADPEKPVFLHKKGGSGGDAEKASQEASKREWEVQAEELRIAFDRLSGNLVGQMGRDELIMILGQASDHQGIDVLLRWMGVTAGPPPKTWQPARQHKIEALVKAVQGEPERYDREAILILVLMAQFCEAVSYQGIAATRFKEFATARGVDFKEVKKAAKEIVKARRAEAKAKKAAKEKKKPKEEREVKAPSLKADVAEVHKRFPDAMPATRAELQKAMGWSVERTLAVYEAISNEMRESRVTGQEEEVEETGSGGEGEGAYRVNESGVVIDPTIVKLANHGKHSAIARLAEIGGSWFVGWDFNGKYWGSSGPVRVNENDPSFPSRELAIHWVAALADTEFREAEKRGEKLPAGFLDAIGSHILDCSGGGEEESRVEESRVEPSDDAGLVAATVRALGCVAGSVVVTWGKIREALALADDDQGTQQAMRVERAMQALGMISKGVLNREAASVKAILDEAAVKHAAPVSAEVSGSGKSKLAAAVAKKKSALKEGEPSEGWMAQPDLEKLDKLYVKLGKALKTWGPEQVFDAVWVKSWVPGVKDDASARILLEEAVHRGLLKADQVVLPE